MPFWESRVFEAGHVPVHGQLDLVELLHRAAQVVQPEGRAQQRRVMGRLAAPTQPTLLAVGAGYPRGLGHLRGVARAAGGALARARRAEGRARGGAALVRASGVAPVRRAVGELTGRLPRGLRGGGLVAEAQALLAYARGEDRGGDLARLGGRVRVGSVLRARAWLGPGLGLGLAWGLGLGLGQGLGSGEGQDGGGGARREARGGWRSALP